MRLQRPRQTVSIALLILLLAAPGLRAHAAPEPAEETEEVTEPATPMYPDGSNAHAAPDQATDAKHDGKPDAKDEASDDTDDGDDTEAATNTPAVAPAVAAPTNAATLAPAPAPKPAEGHPEMSAQPPKGAPQMVTAPQPVPVEVKPPALVKRADDPLTLDLKKQCERHFPGLIQAEVRAACLAPAADFQRLGRGLVETRCRLNFGEEPRRVMACLVGASIADDLVAGRDSFKKKLQLCAETYPVHNEIDAFLQESCLTGIHIPDFMKAEGGQERFTTCGQITPERSFIGPCAVGLTLAQEDSAKVPPANQNRMCEQYFNLHRFHKGYRACLNARSLPSGISNRYADAIQSCSNISSEANNDTERAACLVGLSIYRHMAKQEDVGKRFQKCGANKVTYQDRDYLACLTAASLLDFTDKGGAERGCRDVFKELKSHSRGDCLNALGLF